MALGSHRTNAGIHEHGEFSVSVPSMDTLEVADYCGLVSGRKVDKSVIEKIRPFSLTMPDNRYRTVGEHAGKAWGSGRAYQKELFRLFTGPGVGPCRKHGGAGSENCKWIAWSESCWLSCLRPPSGHCPSSAGMP